MFQDATLLPWASAADNVFLPLRLAGMPREQAMPQVHEALHRVGLDGFEAARPRQLSGGMRMRVSIARALVTRPRLLLMDEPFAALDEFTRHKLQEDLLSLWQELGCTVVFVTHSIYEAAFLARRIVLMTPRPGRIDHEIASPLRAGAEARLDPAYAALVAQVTREWSARWRHEIPAAAAVRPCRAASPGRRRCGSRRCRPIWCLDRRRSSRLSLPIRRDCCRRSDRRCW